MNHLLISLLLLIGLAAPYARAQDVNVGESATALVLGRVYNDSLNAAEVRTYTLDLRADQFVYGEANQETVDLVITIYDPDNKRIATFDGPYRGPEPFRFTSEKVGIYRIEVTPFEDEKGRYSLSLKLAEPLAVTPEGRLDQLLALHRGNDRPGGVVAVIRNGEVTFVRAYGMADLTHRIPIKPETLFNIGSVSKQFAGFAFALLAEQGKLSLEDDVRKYLPEIPDLGPTVTLRHLLNHTSGYREVYGVLALEGRFVNGDILKREDAIAVVQHQPELQFEPGSEFLYNSTAYVLLTTIAERVTGSFYPDWMKQHVFEPLGMTSTRIEREPGDVIAGSAFSYTNAERGGYREDFESYAYYGATDVYTNVYDLARWLRNFRTNELGGRGVMDNMLERSILSNGDTLGYTLGLFIDEYRGLRRIQHGGSTGGYRAFLTYFPDLDAGLAVLANTGAFPVGMVAEEMAGLFFADAMEPETSGSDEAGNVSVAIAPRLREAYPGTYALEDGTYFTITVEGDAFFVQPEREPRTRLSAVSVSLFRVEVPGENIQISFHIEEDSSIVRGNLIRNGTSSLPFLRSEPWSPTDNDLQVYTGRYFSEEVETFYTLMVKDGKLTVSHRRLGEVPLETKERDRFNGSWPLLEIAFERDADSQLNGFRVSNGRTRGVLFQKWQ